MQRHLICRDITSNDTSSRGFPNKEGVSQPFPNRSFVMSSTSVWIGMDLVTKHSVRTCQTRLRRHMHCINHSFHNREHLSTLTSLVRKSFSVTMVKLCMCSKILIRRLGFSCKSKNFKLCIMYRTARSFVTKALKLKASLNYVCMQLL